MKVQYHSKFNAERAATRRREIVWHDDYSPLSVIIQCDLAVWRQLLTSPWERFYVDNHITQNNSSGF